MLKRYWLIGDHLTKKTTEIFNDVGVMIKPEILRFVILKTVLKR